MKNSFLFLAAVLILFISFSCNNKNNTTMTTSSQNKADGEKELRAANDSFYAALNAMFVGNLEPMNEIWSHSEKITDMGPFGGRLTGWKDVGAEFQKEAGMKFGGKVVCKDVHVVAGTDMGYTVCIEEGENMSADGKPVKVSHRATNIFQLENGKWKMVHHQTDLAPQLEDVIKK